MTTPTFNFPYHKVSDQYPESSTPVKYGRGYTFTSEPNGPDQMIFKLRFEAMFQWHDAAGNPTSAIKPTLNTFALQDFYEVVRQSKPILYQHPRRGLLTCRFNKPLPPFLGITDKVIFDKVSNARGHQVEAFDVELMMMPL